MRLVRQRLRSAFGLSLFMLLTACASSPFSAAARFTDNGRLLMDGPSARMTPEALAEDRARTVPILFELAITAGQLDSERKDILGPALKDQVAQRRVLFALRDPAEQQLALSTVKNWGRVAEAGETYIDGQCRSFIDALDQLERSKRATLAGLNVVQSAAVGIMGLAQTAQKAIGVVGIAFGLASSLFDITASTVLYELPAASVASVVQAQRDVLRLHEAAILAGIDSQDRALARLNSYVLYCSPVTIEANIGKLLASARQANDREIEATTQALVTQAGPQSMMFVPPPTLPLGPLSGFAPPANSVTTPASMSDMQAAKSLRDWALAPGLSEAELSDRSGKIERVALDLRQPNVPVAVLLSRRQSAGEQKLAARIARELGQAH